MASDFNKNFRPPPGNASADVEWEEMELRFSLMQLFVSTALVAVGLAIWMRVVRVSGLFHWVLDFPICFIAGAVIGAGVLVPFKRAGLGAVIGLVLSGLYLAVALFG